MAEKMSVDEVAWRIASTRWVTTGQAADDIAAAIRAAVSEEREAVAQMVCEAFRRQGVTFPENHPIIAAIRGRRAAYPLAPACPEGEGEGQKIGQKIGQTGGKQ